MPLSPKPTRALLLVGLALSLAGLLWHAWSYRFLTDDAFIAFRYARNLSQGHGLVFNPGFEAVEGFSSPAWVLLLAACARLGLDLPICAVGLSLGATLVLWGGLLRFIWLLLPKCYSRLWVLIPLCFLALTRSVAVWSSGGLETRLFESLVMLVLLRLLTESEHQERAARTLPLGGALLGLLVWVRPEGALLAVTIPLAVLSFAHANGARRRWVLRSLGAAGLLVAALFGARYFIFGELLSNTYYAKLDGQTWWSMGAAYLGMFALEYGALFSLPLILAGCRCMGLRSIGLQLMLGTCIPLLVYSASTGGDHFEYRILNLIFPYAFVLTTLGAAFLARTPLARIGVGLMLSLSAWGLWSLPRACRIHFPREYQAGFPGLVASQAARQFPDPAGTWLYGMPGFSLLGEWHRALMQYTSRHFVGLRQEEHRLFLNLTRARGQRLARLVSQGHLPADLYVAIDCVGAIPYYSNLRVLDRLGLTDYETGHSNFAREGMSAHGKYASLGVARQKGVGFWALDPTRLLWTHEQRQFQDLLRNSREQGEEFGLAEVQPGLFLLAWIPIGIERAQQRWPGLKLRSSLDTSD